jgi:hypothetical protein
MAILVQSIVALIRIEANKRVTYRLFGDHPPARIEETAAKISAV